MVRRRFNKSWCLGFTPRVATSQSKMCPRHWFFFFLIAAYESQRQEILKIAGLENSLVFRGTHLPGDNWEDESPCVTLVFCFSQFQRLFWRAIQSRCQGSTGIQPRALTPWVSQLTEHFHFEKWIPMHKRRQQKSQEIRGAFCRLLKAAAWAALCRYCV